MTEHDLNNYINNIKNMNAEERIIELEKIKDNINSINKEFSSSSIMSGIGLGWLVLTYLKVLDITEFGTYVMYGLGGSIFAKNVFSAVTSYSNLKDLHEMENVVLRYSDDGTSPKRLIK